MPNSALEALLGGLQLPHSRSFVHEAANGALGARHMLQSQARCFSSSKSSRLLNPSGVDWRGVCNVRQRVTLVAAKRA